MTRARETSENARQAKAWVNFNGAFGTSPFTEANGGIRSSFNVSSVTDLGTGYYRINFGSSFSDADYVAIANHASFAGGGYQGIQTIPYASYADVAFRDGGAATDPTYVYFVVFK